WLEINLREVGRLPATMRTLGRGLLGRQPDGKEFRDWQKSQRARRQAVAQLDRQTPAQREKLFGILFPKLEGEVEAAWQFNAFLPYQTGYVRKAFRAP